MKEFIFELEGDRALLVSGERLGCNRACFRLAKGGRGTLVIGKHRFPITAEGATVSAAEVENGIHTPFFFVDEKCFEGPPFLFGGGYVLLLPPGKDECTALERMLKIASAQIQMLEHRIAALEARLNDTHIL